MIVRTTANYRQCACGVRTETPPFRLHVPFKGRLVEVKVGTVELGLIERLLNAAFTKEEAGGIFMERGHSWFDVECREALLDLFYGEDLVRQVELTRAIGAARDKVAVFRANHQATGQVKQSLSDCDSRRHQSSYARSKRGRYRGSYQ